MAGRKKVVWNANYIKGCKDQRRAYTGASQAVHRVLPEHVVSMGNGAGFPEVERPGEIVQAVRYSAPMYQKIKGRDAANIPLSW